MMNLPLYCYIMSLSLVTVFVLRVYFMKSILSDVIYQLLLLFDCYFMEYHFPSLHL